MRYHAAANKYLVVACILWWDDDMASGETVTGTGVQRMGKIEEADIRRESECADIGNSRLSSIRI